MFKEYDKIITVIVAVASLLLGGYNTWTIQNPPDSSDLVTQGNQFFAHGDYRNAIICYEKALRLHSSFGNALKYKGFALFNLGLGNDSLSVKLDSSSPYDSPCMYATRLIENANTSSYQPTEASRAYFEGSYQYLKDASFNNPADLEALLYSGIVSLYLFPSPSYDPMKDFEKVLNTVDDLYYMQKSLQVKAIKTASWQGKGATYLRMGDIEEAGKCFSIAKSFSRNKSI